MAGDSETGRPVGTGRLPRDFAVGLALLGFCALAYWISLGIGKAPPALAQNVQPATFPRMVLAVIALLTALMMALGLRRDEPARKAPKPVMIATGALMVAFVIAFAELGPLAAMFGFCLIMPVIWGERPSPRLVVYAVLFPLAVHLLFAVGLDVYFPPGVVEALIDRFI
jgi:putative tricarboxylic transport membrane protein